jgi:hypothetical protein
MKEENIKLSEYLKGLTDGERTILWQALTIDILPRMMELDTDVMLMAVRKGDNGRYFVHVDPTDETFVPVMAWHGGRAARS